ncbi:MAG: recombinase family protein [Methylocystaceae bacterium]|nr:recombinase family protein [Methylocystaceae bacterium]
MQSVVIYARHSSDKQVTSTADQIERCKKYCEAKGYKVESILSDEAVSGAIPIKLRKGIQKLLDQAVQESFEKIICEDLSRLSRDQGDIAIFFKKMKFLDIEIETVTEGTISELHIGLKGTMNALYLKDLGDKTHRGMIASVLKGAVPGGRTYGYDTVKALSDGEPVKGLRKINQKQAEVVRNIFTWYLEGKSTYEICDILNRQSIPSAKGGKWLMTTLVGTQSRKTGLLRQTLYKGEITFNRMAYKKHPKTGKRVAVVRDESEWITVPIPELSIISEETFDQVQALIGKRAEERRKTVSKDEHKTVEETKDDKKKDMRKWRARQYRPTAYRQYITSRRLFCSHCDLKITSYKGQTDRCQNREYQHHTSLKRSHSVEKTLARFKSITLEEIMAFNDLPKDSLIEMKELLTTELEEKRTGIRRILEQIGQQDRRGSETMAFLDEQEKACLGVKCKLARVDKRLKELKPLTEYQAKTIQRRIRLLLSQYEQDMTDETIVRRIQSFIRQINVTEGRTYIIDYELEELVLAFR